MDDATLTLPLGGRAIVLSGLALGRTSTPATEAAANEVARALEAADGPGLVVLAGDTFDLAGDPRTTPSVALAAHPRLAAVLRRLAQREGRHVVVVPGRRDRRLATDADAARQVGEATGGVVAGGVEVTVETAAGARVIRIGHVSAHTAEPEQPLVAELVPRVTGRWYAGIDRLDDPASIPHFLVSRTLYRAARWSPVLLVPFVVGALLKLPLSFAFRGTLDRALGSWADRLGIVALITAVDVVLLAAFVAALTPWAWHRIAGGRDRDDGAARPPNDEAQAAARAVIAGGGHGLIVGGGTSELADLGAGVFAATGTCGLSVSQRAGRLGLPPVFVPVQSAAWIEIEAGADLHVRLWYGRTDVAGATAIERLVAVRPEPAAARPEVVAATPGTVRWPLVRDPALRTRTIRRRAAVAIGLAGAFNLVSAITPPFEDRLRPILRVVPLAVPQAASALVAICGLALLTLSRTVRIGHRRGYRIAAVLLATSVFLHLAKGGDVEEAGAAALVLAYLVRHRAAFSTAAARPSRRQALTLAGAVVATVVTCVAALEATTALRGPRLPLPRALLAVVERFVGVRSVVVAPAVDRFAAPTFAAIGVAAAAWALWLLSRSAAGRRTGPDERTRARTAVEQWGGGTLDYFALRDDKEFFFHGSTVAAYAVHHGVCLVSPDPIGPPWEREVAWRALQSFVDRHGWTLAVLGASDAWLPVYRGTGMHDLYVGDEAVVDVGHFALEGGRHKSLRQAVNRVARYGYTISFHDPAEVDADLRARLEDVMKKSRRGDVERGFSMTLGRIFDPADRGLLLAVCHDATGRPVAFCQYVPAPGIDGYSLDLMRRDDGEHPNGLLDFLIVETIRHLAAGGHRRLGLNFATMRAVLAGESGAGITAAVERWALRAMSGSMQIESLWRFNAKFDPVWQPRYLVYDAPEHLARAAFAMARAESFWELPILGRFLVPPAAEDGDRLAGAAT